VMRIVFRGKLGGGLARRSERGGGKQRGLDWSIRRERRESVLLVVTCTFRKLAKLFTEENISLSDFCFTSDSLVRRSGHVLSHTTSSSLLLLRLGFDFSLFFFVREERHKFGIRPYTSLFSFSGITARRLVIDGLRNRTLQSILHFRR